MDRLKKLKKTYAQVKFLGAVILIATIVIVLGSLWIFSAEMESFDSPVMAVFILLPLGFLIYMRMSADSLPRTIKIQYTSPSEAEFDELLGKLKTQALMNFLFCAGIAALGISAFLWIRFQIVTYLCVTAAVLAYVVYLPRYDQWEQLLIQKMPLWQMNQLGVE